MTPRVRGAIGNAVLHDMNVNTRTQRLIEDFSASPLHYLLNREIAGLRVFPMQESGNDPDFIGDF
jgi:hypothetical protein